MRNLFYNINVENKKSLLLTLDSQTATYPSGVSVFNTQSKNRIGFINFGIVQIIRNDYNGDRILVEELKENDVFGSHISSITSQDYEVIAIAPSNITFFDFDDIYRDSVKAHPCYTQLLLNITDILEETLVQRNLRIEILTKKTIRERLLAYFNYLSREQKSKKVYLPFYYTDLADYLSINRTAMYREIGYLKEERLIKVDKRSIYILFDTSNN